MLKLLISFHRIAFVRLFSFAARRGRFASLAPGPSGRGRRDPKGSGAVFHSQIRASSSEDGTKEPRGSEDLQFKWRCMVLKSLDSEIM